MQTSELKSGRSLRVIHGFRSENGLFLVEVSHKHVRLIANGNGVLCAALGVGDQVGHNGQQTQQMHQAVDVGHLASGRARLGDDAVELSTLLDQQQMRRKTAVEHVHQI